MADGKLNETERLAPLERSRSLVLVDRRKRHRGVVCASADFVAQLIASESRLGEFRRARRREPSAGLSAYRQTRLARSPEFETKA